MPFAFEDNLVRVRVDENGAPWFVAKDICRVLDISKYRDAIAQLDEDERVSINVDTPGGPQVMAAVSESGLYALIFRSRKSEAKRIRKWVTSEVLPSIRKTGGYTTPGLAARQTLVELPLPPEALTLRPYMRERLLNDAMQMARLDNAGSEAARRHFADLCRMMVARPEFKDKWGLVYEFMDERLEKAKGHSERFDQICAVLRSWWKDRCPDLPPPGPKIVSEALRENYRPAKSNVTVYRDCRLIG
jgi:prophage antirepressor-like protein